KPHQRREEEKNRDIGRKYPIDNPSREQPADNERDTGRGDDLDGVRQRHSAISQHRNDMHQTAIDRYHRKEEGNQQIPKAPVARGLLHGNTGKHSARRQIAEESSSIGSGRLSDKS